MVNEKIVVIGSNSFSGANFVNSALDSGASVVGMSRSPQPSSAFLSYSTNRRLSSFQFHQLDINNNLPEIMKEIENFRPDYVVNYAAQSMVAESWAQPEHWFQTNVVGQVKFHDRLRTLSGLKKYVHISTPEVYGSCSGAIDESAPYNPSTPYAVSRAAADMSLISFLKNYQFPVVFTRAANVYGPGQQLYRIIPRAILFAKLGKKLQLHGGGHSTRSFIHIDDVSDGTLRAMRSGSPGEVFHLSTAQQISIRDLVGLIADRMNMAVTDLVEVVGERPGKDSAYWLDSGCALKKLDWSAKIDLKSGLEATIAWVEKNFNELKSQPFNYVHKA